MAAVAFDTLKFVERLIAAGIPEGQAKAEAEALQGVFAEALDSQLATKADIARLELRMAGMDGKLTLIQWMLALVVAAEVMPLAAKLFQ
jgi:hypothetical protein